ncbi:MAG: multidrug MFS transporter [Clostridiales bacterium]|nr:multidrug MFS transporter [Clostridiales bacterium]
MIFVTVGTHEQQFNRLVKAMDELKKSGVIQEEVIIQMGYSDYIPVNCQYSDFFSYQQMQKYVEEARIVITHGGPASFIAALQLGKIPIVVPRQYELNEHVNNHQLNFCRTVDKRYGNIILVEDIETLPDIIRNYESIALEMKAGVWSNNDKFCEEFGKLVDEVLEEERFNS